MWTPHLVSCIGVTINGITVDNDLTMANTDALDIEQLPGAYRQQLFQRRRRRYLSENHGQACAYSASAASGYDRELYAAVEKLRLKVGTETGRILKMCWFSNAPSLIPIAGSWLDIPRRRPACGG